MRHTGTVTPSFVPLTSPDDANFANEFLIWNERPFRRVPRLTRDQAASVAATGDDMACFWIRGAGQAIGMIRVFDLDDGSGSFENVRRPR